MCASAWGGPTIKSLSSDTFFSPSLHFAHRMFAVYLEKLVNGRHMCFLCETEDGTHEINACGCRPHKAHTLLKCLSSSLSYKYTVYRYIHKNDDRTVYVCLSYEKALVALWLGEFLLRLRSSKELMCVSCKDTPYMCE